MSTLGSSLSKRRVAVPAATVIVLAAVAIFFGTRHRATRRILSLGEIGDMVAPTKPTDAKPRSGPSSAYSRERYFEIVAKDRFCELLSLGEVPFADQVQALLDLRAVHPARQDMIDLNLLYDGLGRGRGASDALEFFNALLDAKLLDGVTGGTIPEPDYAMALHLLEGLAITQPDNAAFPYFLAAALKNAGAEPSRIRAAFVEAFAKPRFNSYAWQVSEQITDLGFNSPTALLVAFEVLSRLPVPNYLSVNPQLNDLVDLDNEDLEFAHSALGFGGLLMGEAARIKSAAVGPVRGTLEYAVGRMIYLHAWHRLHGDEDDPRLPTYHEWIGVDLPEAAKLYDAYSNDAEKSRATLKGDAQCDRSAADQGFARAREAYLRLAGPKR